MAARRGADVTGRRVGRYEIIGEIGRGGTSIVFLARHVDLGRLVALKQLTAFHSSSPSAAARFLRESRLAGALAHRHVVIVHDYFVEDATPYIAMEHLPHGSLRPLIGKLSTPQLGGILLDVLSALGRAEELGIVHRDLKPENLMITDDGRIKITDFGIAKARGALRDASFVTAEGTTVGTPEYMAPEQALGGEVGPWTDLYALGVIAYEVIALRPPFARREDEEPLALMLRHVNQEPEPLPAGPLAGWVHDLLAKDPADRPSSAQTAADALEPLLGDGWREQRRLPTPASVSPGAAPVDADAVTGDALRLPPVPPAQARAPAAGPARRQWAVVAVLAALAGAAAGVLSGDAGSAPPAGSRELEGAGVRLTVPASWRQVAAALPGGISAQAPDGTRLDAVIDDGAGPELVAEDLRVPRPQRVRLGELEAIQHEQVWGIPLADGVLTLRCSSAAAACTAAAAAARPVASTPLAAGPSGPYARTLRSAFETIRPAALSLARAASAREQVRGASRLARTATAAAQRLGDAPGAWEAGAHRGLQQALRDLAARCQTLARAPVVSGTRLRTTRGGVDRALRALVRARRAFRALGYAT